MIGLFFRTKRDGRAYTFRESFFKHSKDHSDLGGDENVPIKIHVALRALSRLPIALHTISFPSLKCTQLYPLCVVGVRANSTFGVRQRPCFLGGINGWMKYEFTIYFNAICFNANDICRFWQMYPFVYRDAVQNYKVPVATTKSILVIRKIRHPQQKYRYSCCPSAHVALFL